MTSTAREAHELGSPLCIGVDVGGTFTDVVLTGAGTTWRSKAPTTADDLGRGVLDACRLVAERAGISLGELLARVGRFGLGTTAVTNALATRRGRRVGLITTAGFEDLVPLARGRRVNEDGWLVMPPQVVERDRIMGVRERIDRHGAVLTELEPDDVIAAAEALIADRGVQAIAVSFLWSFRNPAHEERAVGALRQHFPDLPVTSGAALHPVIREFERSTFALLNAYTSGALTGVDKLAADLAELGLAVPLLLVHSGGGSTTVAEAHRMPISLAESGPAAGVAAAVEVARSAEITDAVTCDMGGTSFDVSVVSDGQAIRRVRGDLMGIWTALSLVDVDSIGSGGGSIGWVDARRMLRVGPHSAGAVPGPACYGRGGTEPTVTDALLVLGFLAPDRFLGGEMSLDAGAALQGCAALGAEVGLDAVETAWGIREIALAEMVKAVRGRLAERGLDPRGRSIVSFGGCAGLFTADIAAAIGIDTVVIPELASVLSAFGAATADVRRERTQSLEMPLPIDVDAVAVLADKLRAQVDADVAADGVDAAHRSVHFEADLRFSRQKWELTVPLAGSTIDTDVFDRMVADFRTDYARRYGEGALMAGATVELVSLRAIGIGQTVKPDLSAAAPGDPATSPAPVGGRAVRLARDGTRTVDVYAGADLQPGQAFSGPALVDGADTTVWIPANARARMDSRKNLIVEVR